LRKLHDELRLRAHAALGLNGKRGDLLKTIKFNFGTKPKPKAKQVDAFNGVTCGKGHETGAGAPPKNGCATADKENLAAAAAK